MSDNLGLPAIFGWKSESAYWILAGVQEHDKFPWCTLGCKHHHTRCGVIAVFGKQRFDMFVTYFGPVTLLAMIYTDIFGLQGHQAINQIGDVFRVAVPML